MMNKTTYLILIIAFLLGACEKIIDISVPDQSRKIVVGAIINPDEIVEVKLSQSKSILEDDGFVFLEDAEVKLFEDNQYVGSLDYRGYSSYILPDFYPASERSYRIEVMHSVLASVESEIVIPKPISIIAVDTSRSIEEWGGQTFKMDVKIDDPPGVDNYYAMSIAVTSRIFDWETETYLDSTETNMAYLRSVNEGDSDIGEEFLDQNLTYFIDDKLFFSDALFDGNNEDFELKVEYYIWNDMVDSVLVDVRVDHIDPSYYYHSVSKQKYFQADGNPFAEPVQVFSNIENGFGLFSAYSRSSWKFSLMVGGRK